jgi:HD superfamily phosphohydrolase
MQANAGRVRDPVHGYIPFTEIERTLFDHPVAQRLRSVSQSAAAHLVFPEMRVSRFAHSLGAMHLASRFFAMALRNAAAAEREQIIAGCRTLVDEYSGLGLGEAEKAIVREPALIAGHELEMSDRAPVQFVEQGLRLASLVHDLGHLPFSHDFEIALDARMRVDQHLKERLAALYAPEVRGDKIHERVGYALASTVQERIFNQDLVGTPSAKVAEVSLLIARAILDAPAAPELDADPTRAVLSWLHSLVDGEIDVDRADYVLRDVRAYGLAAAVYDLDRLADSLTVVRSTGNALVTAILPPGVSAAEAFFVARFRMYTWAIYHHKIQQAAAGLRVAVEDVLGSGGQEVARFLDAIAMIAAGGATDSVLDEFADFDDVWFTTLMRERLRSGVPGDVEPWSELFLRRRRGPVSLWKRPSDFPVQDRASWNRRLPTNAQPELRGRWDEIAREMRADELLLHRLPFVPWRKDHDGESRLQVALGGPTQPLTHLAPLVRALAGAWDDALQVHVYAARPGSADPQATIERLEPALGTNEEHA